MGRTAAGTAPGRRSGRVEVLTADSVAAYLEGDRWDGAQPRDVVID